eukprot:10311366-Karenia_brevis.AAC.1
MPQPCHSHAAAMLQPCRSQLWQTEITGVICHSWGWGQIARPAQPARPARTALLGNSLHSEAYDSAYVAS